MLFECGQFVVEVGQLVETLSQTFAQFYEALHILHVVLLHERIERVETALHKVEARRVIFHTLRRAFHFFQNILHFYARAFQPFSQRGRRADVAGHVVQQARGLA